MSVIDSNENSENQEHTVPEVSISVLPNDDNPEREDKNPEREAKIEIAETDVAENKQHKMTVDDIENWWFSFLKLLFCHHICECCRPAYGKSSCCNLRSEAYDCTQTWLCCCFPCLNKREKENCEKESKESSTKCCRFLLKNKILFLPIVLIGLALLCGIIVLIIWGIGVNINSSVLGYTWFTGFN